MAGRGGRGREVSWQLTELIKCHETTSAVYVSSGNAEGVQLASTSCCWTTPVLHASLTRTDGRKSVLELGEPELALPDLQSRSNRIQWVGNSQKIMLIEKLVGRWMAGTNFNNILTIGIGHRRDNQDGISES